MKIVIERRRYMNKPGEIPISVVVPMYNQKRIAIKNMGELDRYLNKHFTEYEIVLVDDGSCFNERLYMHDLPRGVRLVQLERNMGKGNAIKEGMSRSRGLCRVFTDIDLPYDLSAILYSYRLISSGYFDFVGGDRTLFNSESRKSTLPFLRRLASGFFSKAVTLFVIGGIFDSQCGFKAFSKRLAENLFPLLTIHRFCFDVEIYYLLLKYNILIKRIPVRLCHHDSTSVSLIIHGIEMVRDIIGIPLKWYSGRYASAGMRDLSPQVYWK